MTRGGSVQIRILGPIEVVSDGGATASLSPQLRRALALLVIADGAIVSTDRLAEYIADGHVEGSAVRTAVSRLRKVVGDRIEHHDGGYRLDLARARLDATEFNRRCCEARTRDVADRVPGLTAALELWRGDALGELGHEEWAEPSVASLTAARLTAIEDLAESQIASGSPAAAVVTLEGHVVRHPFRERPVGLLMRALAADGRVVEAVRALRTYRAMLRDETGLEPGRELRAIEADVLDAAAGDQSSLTKSRQTADSPTIDRPAHDNLPSAVTPLVHRETELDEIRALLANGRLVTLSGTAGVGKTATAIEASRRMRHHFAGGRWLIELAPLAAGDDVSEAVQAEIGDDESEAANEPTLVVVDSCEHVLASVRRVIPRLLEASPNLTVLCTSRQPLSVAGETTYRLEPLATAPAGELRGVPSDAAALFELVALAAGGLASDHDADAAQIERIASGLGGLPLSIQLGAACLRTMTLDELEVELDDQLDLLRRDAPDDGDRHVSLRAAIGWSTSLLSPTERQVFGQLAVFTGRFDRQDLDEIVRSEADEDLVAAVVRRLVERSLVQVRPSPRGSCFELLDAIRQFAAEELARSGTEPEVRTRHAATVLRRVNELLVGSTADATDESLERTLPELQAGVRWMRSTDDPRLHDAIQALAKAASRLGRSELHTGATERALELAEAGLNGNPEDVELLSVAAGAAWRLDQLEVALTHGLTWASIAQRTGRVETEAEALRLVARVTHEMHDSASCNRATERLLGLIDRLDALERARSWVLIAQLHQLRYEDDLAVAAADRAMGIAEELGAEEILLEARVEKGSALLDTPRQAEAIDLLYEAAAQAEERREHLLAARALFNLANFIADFDERRRVLRASQRAGRRAGWAGAGDVASKLVDVAIDEGDLLEARRLADGALATTTRLKAATTRLSCVFLALEAGEFDAARQLLDRLADDDLEPSDITHRDAWALRLAAADGDTRRVEAQVVRLVEQHHRRSDLWVATACLDDLHELGVDHASLSPLLSHVAEPDSDEAHLLRGWVNEVADPAVARVAYRQALDVDHSTAIEYRIDPVFRADAHLGIARLDVVDGRLDAAVGHLDRAVELLKGWPGPRRRRAEMIRESLVEMAEPPPQA